MPNEAHVNKIKSISYDHLCGKGVLMRLNIESLKITLFPIRCKSWRCPICGPRLAELWRAKIVNAKPERFITLTWDPKKGLDAAHALQHMKVSFARLVRILRNQKFTFEYCAIWEFTKKGYPHIHIAQRGSFIPQKKLSEIWSTLGAGPVVDIRAIQSGPAIAQELTKYLLKSAQASKELLQSFRLIQASKNFFERDVSAHPAACCSPQEVWRTPGSLLSTVQIIEHYFFYTMLSCNQGGVIEMAPRNIDNLNFIIPEGFEGIGGFLADRRRPSCLDPPEQRETLAQLSELWGL